MPLDSRESADCQFRTLPAAQVNMCITNSTDWSNFSITLTQHCELLDDKRIECRNTFPDAIYAWWSLSVEVNLSTGKFFSAEMYTRSLNKPIHIKISASKWKQRAWQCVRVIGQLQKCPGHDCNSDVVRLTHSIMFQPFFFFFFPTLLWCEFEIFAG